MPRATYWVTSFRIVREGQEIRSKHFDAIYYHIQFLNETKFRESEPIQKRQKPSDYTFGSLILSGVIVYSENVFISETGRHQHVRSKLYYEMSSGS